MNTGIFEMADFFKFWKILERGWDFGVFIFSKSVLRKVNKEHDGRSQHYEHSSTS